MNSTLARFLLGALMLPALAGGLPALGNRDQAAPSPALSPPGEPPAGEPLTLTGRIRLVGSAGFSSLVLTDGDDRDWYLEGPDRELLARREQQTVTVRGLPEYRDMVLANGQKVGIRRFLRDITLR